MLFTDVPCVRISINPLLLRILLFAACFGTTVSATETPAVRHNSDPIQDKQIQFDIPAQALREALLAYAKATGFGVLVDDAVAAGRQSAPVKGSFTPEQGLKALLERTGLEYQYTAASAFTLVPAPVAPTRDDSRDQSYFRTIQNVVKSTLCSRAQTLPGAYRVVIQLWINVSGVVLRSALLGSTGNPDRDRMLPEMLDGLPIGVAPPDGLPQPVTLIILPRALDVTRDCGPADHGLTKVRG